MKKNEYGKALLYSYRYLETMCNAIDKFVKRKSINSLFYESCRPKSFMAFEVSDHIIKLIERKRKLINTKVIIEECIRDLKPLQQRILLLTYLDNMSAESIQLCLKMTPRTFYRKKSEAINSFCRKLAQKGYEENFIMIELMGEKWFNTFRLGANHKENLGRFSGGFLNNLIRDLNRFDLVYC